MDLSVDSITEICRKISTYLEFNRGILKFLLHQFKYHSLTSDTPAAIKVRNSRFYILVAPFPHHGLGVIGANSR